MTPPPSGACCVCGKETTKRCAACGKAGFSLYFCSKEHQELIWYAHKPFCGPNSKPFSFPPLSKEEAAEAKTILYERFMVLPSPPTSLAEVLNKLCLGSGHDLGCRMTNSLLADVLDRLQADTLPAMFSLWEKHRLLCHVRVALRAVTATFTSDKPVESNNTVRFNFSDAPAVFFLPLRATAKFAVRLAQGLKAALLEPYPVDDDWYIQLMHQAVVVSAFRQLQHAERLKAYNAADPKPCTHDELLHFSWPESFYAYDALLKSSADELVLQTNLLAKADEKKGKAALVAVESMLMGTMHKLEIEGGWARIVLAMLPPPDLSNANAVPLGRPPPPSYQPPKRRRAHPPKKTKAKRKPTVLPTLDVSPARQHARPELDNADERERKRTRWASPAPPRPPRRDSPSPPPLPHPQPSRPSRLPKLRIPPALLDVPSRPSSAAKRMPPALLDRLAPLPSPPRVASRSPSPPPPPPAIEVQLPLWERHPAPAPAPVSPMSPTPSLTPDLSPSCASSSSSASFADLAGDTPLAPTRFTYFPLPAAAQEEGMKKGKEKEERERGWTRCLAYADLPRLLAVEAATADEPPPVPSHSLAHPDLRPPSRPSSALRSNRNPQTGRGSFDPLLVAPAVRPAAPVPAAPSGTAYATGWWRFRTPQEVAVSQYCSARVYVGAPWGFGGGGRGWR